MSKMTVIQLLNKIANGEEVPKKIKYKGHIYQYQYKDTKEANIINYYHSEETHHHLIDGGWHDIRLNDEVEIIENKKIEKMSDFYEEQITENGSMSELFNKHELKIIDKINEIIDKINKMEDK